MGDHAPTYKGCLSGLIRKILLMLVRGVEIRDIAEIEKISVNKILSVSTRSDHNIRPEQSRCDGLEVEESWTYAGDRKNKVRLIYACRRETGEIPAHVWGKRNFKTAKKLRDKSDELNVGFDTVYSDARESFLKAFENDNLIVGKKNTIGTEGNNCRSRHGTGRAFRKTCRFSKKPANHSKAFDFTFFISISGSFNAILRPC